MIIPTGLDDHPNVHVVHVHSYSQDGFDHRSYNSVGPMGSLGSP